MASYPQITPSDVFNPSLFISETSGLTLANADQRYVRIGSAATLLSLNVGTLYINSALVDFSAISGVVPGTSSANKALIVDGDRNITNINFIRIDGGNDSLNVKAAGTTQRANILFTNDNRSLELGLRGSGASAPANGFYIYQGGYRLIINSSGNCAIGNSAANYKMDIYGDCNVQSGSAYKVNGVNVIDGSNVYGTLQTAAQPNITSVGTLTSLDVATANIDTGGFGTFNGITSYGGVSIDNGSSSSGSAVVSQSWNFDSAVQVMLTMRNWITGTNYAEFGSMTDQDFHLIQNGSRRMTLLTSGNVKITNSLMIGANTLDSAMVGCLSGITFGTASASKALVLDSSRNISNIATLGCGNITMGSGHDRKKIQMTNPTSTTDYYGFGTAADYVLYGSKKGHQFFGSSTTSANGTEICKMDDKNFFFGDAIASVIDTPAAGIKGGFISGTKGSTVIYWRIGNHGSTKNLFTFEWTPTGDGNDANKLHLDAWGTSNCMVWRADNRVSVNGDPNTSYRFTVNGNTKCTSDINCDSGITCNGSSSFTDILHDYARVGGTAAKARYFMLGTTSIYCGMGMHDTGTTIRIGQCTDATGSWSGSYCAIQGGAYTNASDARLKKDIEDLPYGLNDVMKMHPVKYTLKEDDSTHIGFIAQELQAILPESVSGEPDAVDENGVIKAMGIDLASLTAVLCKAIQQQQKKINELEQRINSM